MTRHYEPLGKECNSCRNLYNNYIYIYIYIYIYFIVYYIYIYIYIYISYYIIEDFNNIISLK